MDACSRRSPSSSSSAAAATSSVVAAGSVWETRMRSDEVRGGIKVFNGGGEAAEGDNKQSNAGAGREGNGEAETLPPPPKGADHKRSNGVSSTNGVGKRKTWKSDQGSGDGGQVSRSRSDQQLSVSQSQKKGKKEAAVAEKSPIQGRKLRSELPRSSPELRKVKSGSGKGGSSSDSAPGGSARQLRKAKSEPVNFVDGAGESIRVGAAAAAEKGEAESGSDGVSGELAVCEDKVVTSSGDQKSELSGTRSTDVDEPDEEYSDEEEGEEEEEEEETFDQGVEVKSSEDDIKEIDMADGAAAEERKQPPPANANKQPRINTKPTPISVSTSANRQPPPSPSTPPEAIKRTTTITTSTRVYNKNIASPTPSKPVSYNARRTSRVHHNYAKPTSYEHDSFPRTQNKLQNLVDLVMWRDASKSAFVFGVGAFAIISSSYTRDIDISFITVVSYLGLVYLAAIFLYRSIICRGYVDIQNTGNVVGEDEAIWLLKMVLPYLNEFLLKLRALFSGDPATTMKLAVLLFVMARCGSSITIWKMAKLGFFGAFTVPKVCSSYSTQISAYGKFWIRRFQDAWDSCSHKKAVAFAVFTLVWNLSSIVARAWAAFMLFVAFRYYQQSIVTEEWEKDGGRDDASWQGRAGGPIGARGPTLVEPTKERKAS